MLYQRRLRCRVPQKTMKKLVWFGLLIGASTPFILLAVEGQWTFEKHAASEGKAQIWKTWENGAPKPETIDKGGEEMQGIVVRGLGRPSSKCVCRRDPLGINSYLTEESRAVRRKELDEWEKRHKGTEDPIVVCKAMSPLTYIGGGITIEPLDKIKIPGLSVHKTVQFLDYEKSGYTLKVQSTAEGGILSLELPDKDFRKSLVKIAKRRSHYLEMRMPSDLELINHVLKHVAYQNLPGEFNERDLIEVTFLNFTVSVHIRIRRQMRPVLYDPGDAIHSKITVITKTFERYDYLNRLVRSINKFYPQVGIIVADDSSSPQKLDGSNVKHYTMPYGEGWFAGRNLALSQVRTKYFVWVEDVCEFTSETKLEKFLEKFDKSVEDLDVVGGSYLGAKIQCEGCLKFDFKKGHPYEGDCLFVDEGSHQISMSDFPQCVSTDVVDNFFMGKTQTVRQIGFDPALDRVGHWEFFADAYGRLRIVSCNDVKIKRHPVTNGKQQTYDSMWDSQVKDAHVQFKNYLKCMKFY